MAETTHRGVLTGWAPLLRTCRLITEELKEKLSSTSYSLCARAELSNNSDPFLNSDLDFPHRYDEPAAGAPVVNIYVVGMFDHLFCMFFSFFHNNTISDDGNAWKLNKHMQDTANSFGQAFWLLMYVLLQCSSCETCFWNGPCYEQTQFDNNCAEWIPIIHQPRLENPQVEPDWRSVACHLYPLLFRLWNGVRIDLHLPSGAYLVPSIMALL